MSSSRNKFVLILLLALLQCFAPLLHAHTHASFATNGVHIDGMDELAVADSGKPAFTEEGGHDAPAITMAQEYRQDGTIALPDVDLAVLAAPALSLSTVFFRMPFLAVSLATLLPGGPLVHSRPFSQAPPHLI